MGPRRRTRRHARRYYLPVVVIADEPVTPNAVPVVDVAAVTVAADVDKLTRRRFLRRIGYIPLPDLRTHYERTSPPPLPVAEAYALWARWQEANEPPAAMYDQLALEVAS